MTSTRSAAEIRESLDHPVIDVDGHMLESYPVLLDFVKDVAGSEMATLFADRLKASDDTAWHAVSPEERNRRRIARPPFFANPTRYTLDRATAMLPGLLRERLDEFGFDFTIIYPTLGFYLPMESDDDVRPAVCRAYNTMVADIYGPHADRITPAACIPTNTPEEAVQELEYAVNELGLKVAMIASLVHRPIAAAADTGAAGFASWLDPLGLDSEYDYDPFWSKCMELGIAPTAHTFTMGTGTRRSTTNYMYNQIGHFAEAGHAFAKALFLGGVTHRFPDLNFGILEGGVGWACDLLASLVSCWEKRNGKAVSLFDPAAVDRAELSDLFDQYGGERFKGRLSNSPDKDRQSLGYAAWGVDPTTVEGQASDADLALLDDFAAAGVAKADDILDRFVKPLYFGCEADDPMTSMAFSTKALPFGAKLKPVLGSDIGHWDVPDMKKVLEEAYELVEKELISEHDFREFTFANPVRLHAGMNPDFFKGTAVEDAVDAFLIEDEEDAAAA